MSVLIFGVEDPSPASSAGIVPGEHLVSINGHKISDVLDYRFYMIERRLRLEILGKDQVERTVKIKKGEYDELGLTFETYLIDKQHSCRNQCVFCFIDQMPPGLRDTLYFKDDDERMSFLFGNYITLTNLTTEEVDRIIKLRISPVNVSVHTMNPQLRVKMMNNRFAGEVLSYLNRLKDGEIAINAQIVLCPDLNDKEELRFSLEQLGALVPALQSVAVVPVGLTKYRDGLYPLRSFNKEEAVETIALIHEFAQRFLEEWADRIFYPSDEWFLLAEQPLPDSDYYGDYPQLENGVGLLTLLRQEFLDALESAETPEIPVPETLSMVTGVAAGALIRELAAAFMARFPHMEIHVYVVENAFLGESVTVAGLLTGGDIFNALRGRPLGNRLLLPQVMLRSELDRFLDDMPLDGLSGLLGVPIQTTPNDGYQLLDILLGL